MVMPSPRLQQVQHLLQWDLCNPIQWLTARLAPGVGGLKGL